MDKLLLPLLLIGGLFSSACFALGGWSGASKISQIYPAPGENGILIKHGSMPNPDNCPSPSYYILKKDNILFNEIYALLVAAQARQASINIQVVGCGGSKDVFPSIFQVIAE
ncbi:hypothetical protein HG263_17500 [Pseudoalteromonas sp. JBTF-M23]|uniref:Uncharacterized protein n=1 Tax=Pseudoalteromonas caenipelagi TaxID=2726988 RepID=A0A849VGC5_9GAMM|nr:hypothetical protein [Pseudoalteromonas caenipelagi]NOU52326.1 hypothetical protein [Pseudoalteromonas caenipelagi]